MSEQTEERPEGDWSSLEEAIRLVHKHMEKLEAADFKEVKPALSAVLAAAEEFLNELKQLDEADEVEDKGA